MVDVKRMIGAACGVVLMAFTGAAAFGGNASEPVGEPTLEMPTLHSLGVWWGIAGDDNRNATIAFSYRKAGTEEWHKAPPLFRVEKGLNKNLDGKTSAPVPEGAWLFAGSALLLEPETAYELKLTLVDPDGGNTEKLLKQATIGEPVAPAGMKEVHVVPGNGGGTGTAGDPFKGIDAAMTAVEPGTRVLLHAGTYAGPVVIKKSGEEGKPIILEGAGDGEAIIAGPCPLPNKQTENALELRGMHDVWLEHLTVMNGFFGIVLNDAQRIVIQRCNIHDVHVGIWGGSNKTHVMHGFFISDNVVKGPLPFPCPPELWHKEFTVGIEVGGEGNEVCYNQVTNMEDSVDTCELVNPCCAMDFHNNDGFNLADDGSEMDGSERNTRFFYNRYTNSLTGVSFQPVYGGPAYAFRNVSYNFRTEATKLHFGGTVPQTGGAVLVHNTFVHFGPAWFNYGGAPVVGCYSRDNLFIGTESSEDKVMKVVDGVTIFFSPKLEQCDFDYDGFSGFKGKRFMKYNNVYYATPEEAMAKSGIEKHLVMLDPAGLFASGIQPPTRNPAYDPAAPEKPGWSTMMLNSYTPSKVDLRLKAGCAAIGVGEVLEGFGDDPKGPAYLGAYAPGAALPWYGPRPEKK